MNTSSLWTEFASLGLPSRVQCPRHNALKRRPRRRSQRSTRAPGCPACGGPMVVRAHRHGTEVDGLFWGCRKPMVCSGTRKIRDPLVIQPLADASTMAIFEWERSRDRRGWVGGIRGTAAEPRRAFGPIWQKPHARLSSSVPSAALAMQPDHPLDTLPEYGFVILDGRQVASAHVSVAHLVVGPTGVFVVDRKAWPGQVSSSSDAVYVDGRQRTGARTTSCALRTRSRRSWAMS